MALVPDQGAVQELASTGLYPALHEGVHPGHLDACGDHLPAGVGHKGVEGGRELRVAVADQESGLAADVIEVHEEVTPELHDPLRGRVRGGAQAPDAPCRVLDDGEDVQPRPSQGADLEEIAGDQCVGLAAQKVRPGRALPFGRGRDAVLLEDLPDGGGAGLDAQRR